LLSHGFGEGSHEGDGEGSSEENGRNHREGNRYGGSRGLSGPPGAELLGRLNLEEEEDAGFVWTDEVKEPTLEAKWLAIAKVHTQRGFSPSALYADMRSAWNQAKDVAWRKIEDNLFTI
jgi:hypothetical protein